MYTQLMELWFIASIAAVIAAGVSSFFFKVAAKRGYSSELFMLLSGISSIVFVSTALILLNGLE